MDLNKLITVLVEQVYEIFEADPILSMKLILIHHLIAMRTIKTIVSGTVTIRCNITVEHRNLRS